MTSVDVLCLWNAGNAFVELLSIVHMWQRICTHTTHLGGAGGHVHGNHGLAVLQQHLGGCDVLVARPQYLVHLSKRNQLLRHPLSFQIKQIQRSQRKKARCWNTQTSSKRRQPFSIAVTFGQVSVPHAMAATACAPPARSTWVTPAFLAQYRTCTDVTTRRTLSLCDSAPTEL